MICFQTYMCLSQAYGYKNLLRKCSHVALQMRNGRIASRVRQLVKLQPFLSLAPAGTADFDW